MTDSHLSGLSQAPELSIADRIVIEDLLHVRSRMLGRNAELDAYYEGDVAVDEYGVTVDPDTVRNDQVCHWPQKAVSALAERVRFDGFAFEGGYEDEGLSRIVRDNGLKSAYARFSPSCYTHGCMFATVGRGMDGRTSVRLHDAETAFALPGAEYESGIVSAGLSMVRADRTAWSPSKPVPTIANVYLPGSVITLRALGPSRWSADKRATPAEEPMMLAFAHKATGTRPLGQSRITKAVKSLTRDAIRVMWRMDVAGAFYSIPHRYVTGIANEQYDEFEKKKAKLYADMMLLMTTNENGDAPAYGQLSSNSPQPFIDQLRALASMFSGATGVPLNSLGIVQDNPSSAEAIMAAREDICIAAEDQIEADKAVLRKIALLAMAVEGNTTVPRLTDAQASVMARFADPAMPSIVSQADAMVKVASVAKSIVDSEVFWERLGFDEETRRRIMEDRRRADASRLLESVYAKGGADGGD